MRTTLKVGGALTAAVLTSGVFYASTASAGGSANTPAQQTQVTSGPTAPARVFAVVNATGTLVRGKAVASTTTLSTGVYDVRFLRDITKCAWSGTVGVGTVPFGGSAGPSMISVSGRAGTNNGLFVQTFNNVGAATGLPFQVVVTCS